jgi:hypothetical protein
MDRLPQRLCPASRIRSILHASVVLTLSGCALASPSFQITPRENKSSSQGFWQATDQPDYFVAVEDSRLIWSFGGQVQRAATILKSSESTIRVCEDGQEKTLELSLDGKHLILRDMQTSETYRLKKLSARPTALTLHPLQIPESVPISPQKAQQIEGELGRRVQMDQMAQKGHFERLWGTQTDKEVLSSPPTPPGLPDLRLIAIKSENTAYLKNLISTIGWIDSERFGPTAADAAFLLTQHSQDLSLMLAVLPHIKKEVEAGHLQGETYALLYDRLQLLLGRKQLYGTRVGKDAMGQPFVLPVEEPEKIDERRRKLGMVPLSEYVQIFGATEVRFSPACAAAGDHS